MPKQKIATEVTVTYFVPDYEDPAEAVMRRLMTYASVPPCLFLNPLVTIVCAEPTDPFYKAVERFRRQWCRTAKLQFHPRTCRSAAAWCRHKIGMSHSEQALDFLLGFKGALYINGKLRKKPTHLRS